MNKKSAAKMVRKHFIVASFLYFLMSHFAADGYGIKKDFKIKFCKINTTEESGTINLDFLNNKHDWCSFLIFDKTVKNISTDIFQNDINRKDSIPPRPRLLSMDFLSDSDIYLSNETLKALKNFDGIYVNKFECLLPNFSPPSCYEYLATIRKQLYKNATFVIEIDGEAYYKDGLNEFVNNNFDYIVISPSKGYKKDGISLVYIRNLNAFTKIFKEKLVVSMEQISDTGCKDYLWGLENVTNFLFSINISDSSNKIAKRFNNFGQCNYGQPNVPESNKLIYCYYSMSDPNTESINIPLECDRVIIEDAFVLNTALQFRESSTKFSNLIETKAKRSMQFIASIKCEKKLNLTSDLMHETLINLVHANNVDGIEFVNCDDSLKNREEFENFLQNYKNYFENSKVLGYRIGNQSRFIENNYSIRQIHDENSCGTVDISILNRFDYVATSVDGGEHFYKTQIRCGKAFIKKGLNASKIVDFISPSGILNTRKIVKQPVRNLLQLMKLNPPGTYSHTINYTKIHQNDKVYAYETREFLIFERIITRNQICLLKKEILTSDNAEYHYNFHIMVLRLANNNISITFDDEEIINFLVTEYIRNNYGGIAIYPLKDDWNGVCGNEKFSVLRLINKRFKSYDEKVV